MTDAHGCGSRPRSDCSPRDPDAHRARGSVGPGVVGDRRQLDPPRASAAAPEPTRAVEPAAPRRRVDPEARGADDHDALEELRAPSETVERRRRRRSRARRSARRPGRPAPGSRRAGRARSRRSRASTRSPGAARSAAPSIGKSSSTASPAAPAPLEPQVAAGVRARRRRRRRSRGRWRGRHHSGTRRASVHAAAVARPRPSAGPSPPTGSGSPSGGATAAPRRELGRDPRRRVLVDLEARAIARRDVVAERRHQPHDVRRAAGDQMPLLAPAAAPPEVLGRARCWRGGSRRSTARRRATRRRGRRCGASGRSGRRSGPGRWPAASASSRGCWRSPRTSRSRRGRSAARTAGRTPRPGGGSRRRRSRRACGW